MRIAVALFLLIPVLAIGDNDTEPGPVEDFYITLTANDLCLCGEGFGGVYGCIDEAVSREAKSVVIVASSDASTPVMQALINAVHAEGFDTVGFETYDEADT